MKMKKVFIFIATVVLLVFVVLCFFKMPKIGKGDVIPPKVITTANTSISFDESKIKEIKKLELMVFPYGDILKQELKISGKVVGYAYYMFNGIGQLMLDLERIEINKYYDEKASVTNITVVLPEVEVGGAKVFHHDPRATTNEYKWLSGLIGDYKEWKDIKLSDMDKKMRAAAQNKIRDYLMRPENIKRAREQAENILRAILERESVHIIFDWPKTVMKDVKSFETTH